MIYDEGKTRILEFGEGDIVVALAYQQDQTENEVAFVQSYPGKIGESDRISLGTYTGEVDTRVRMIFHRVDSLDVLIRKLTELKEIMIGGDK
jgi:hypothetical protein